MTRAAPIPPRSSKQTGRGRRYSEHVSEGKCIDNGPMEAHDRLLAAQGPGPALCGMQTENFAHKSKIIPCLLDGEHTTLSTSRSVERGTGAFIYALSADETRPVPAAPCPRNHRSVFLPLQIPLPSTGNIPPFLVSSPPAVSVEQKSAWNSVVSFSKQNPYFIFANRSTAFVKLSMVFSASPCSIPSLTQCLICPSSTTCPAL